MPLATYKLVVAPRKHFTDVEISSLLDDFRGLGFDVEVRPYKNPFVDGRCGVPWWESIDVYLHAVESGAKDVATGLLKDAAKDVAKEGLKAAALMLVGAFGRWAKARAKLPGRNPKHPKCLTVYDADGKTELTKVTVDDPDGQPKVTTDAPP